MSLNMFLLEKLLTIFIILLLTLQKPVYKPDVLSFYLYLDKKKKKKTQNICSELFMYMFV